MTVAAYEEFLCNPLSPILLAKAALLGKLCAFALPSGEEMIAILPSC